MEEVVHSMSVAKTLSETFEDCVPRKPDDSWLHLRILISEERWTKLCGGIRGMESDDIIA